MGDFTIKHRDELERAGDWSLVRRSLGLGAFGMNIVDIPPGGDIPAHDETKRNQEEVFFVLDGELALEIDGEPHTLREGTFARLDPGCHRVVENKSDSPLSLLIVSAPTDSGYEPMDWA